MFHKQRKLLVELECWGDRSQDCQLLLQLLAFFVFSRAMHSKQDPKLHEVSLVFFQVVRLEGSQEHVDRLEQLDELAFKTNVRVLLLVPSLKENVDHSFEELHFLVEKRLVISAALCQQSKDEARHVCQQEHHSFSFEHLCELLQDLQE